MTGTITSFRQQKTGSLMTFLKMIGMLLVNVGWLFVLFLCTHQLLLFTFFIALVTGTLGFFSVIPAWIGWTCAWIVAASIAGNALRRIFPGIFELTD